MMHFAWLTNRRSRQRRVDRGGRLQANASVDRLKTMRLRCGFGLVEVAVSTVLVSLVLVGAMQLFAMKLRQDSVLLNREVGDLLANDLMAEILRRPYQDAVTPLTMGRDVDELLTGKDTFDDVDDYIGWSESPPYRESGQFYPYSGSWSRSVAVDYVQLTNVSQTSLLDLGDTGVKRIRVEVRLGSRLVCSLTALSTKKIGL